MKLTQLALQRIRDKKIRALLALALNVTDQSIVNYINRNHDFLTKAAALKVIREETGLTDEQILQEETETARA